MDPDARPARRGRPPKGEARDTRSAIFDAALDLFARQGFAGTSVREIARAAGLSDGGLYRHFPSKQAVFDALLAEWGPSVVPEVMGGLPPDLRDQPADCVRELVRRVVAAWEQPRVRRFMDVFVREGGYGSDLGRGRVAEERWEAQRRLGQLFQSWIEAGLMPRDVAPEILAWELLSPVAYIRILYFHGRATQEERDEGRRLAAGHAEFFIAYVLRGLSSPADPPVSASDMHAERSQP
jgi:AcrR family transcriptional regulator